MKNLLLISNSTMAGEPYLKYTLPYVKSFLEKIKFENNKPVIFIPYAAVTFSFDEYEQKVNKAFSEINIEVQSIHKFEDKKSAIKNAGLIITGGGNTWHLVKTLQQEKLINVIFEAVTSGIPYIGWSAGSNIACPTLKTTNDMPIVEPESFKTVGLIDFQINPHYLDANPDGHAGETREQRIEEFITANKNTYVVGLREGTMLQIDDNDIILLGNKNARIFKYGKKPIEVPPETNLKNLLTTK